MCKTRTLPPLGYTFVTATAPTHSDHIELPGSSDKVGDKINFDLKDLNLLSSITGVSKLSQDITASLLGPTSEMQPYAGLAPGDSGKV